MIRTFAVLIAAVLAGCATTGGGDFTEKSEPFASHVRFHELEQMLANAPSDLRRHLKHAADRLHPSAEAMLAIDRDGAPGLLRELLNTSNDPLLKTNAEFDALSLIVVGERAVDSGAFQTALSGYLGDPDFSCRQPNFARYFRQRYADTRTLSACSPTVPFSLITPYEGLVTIWLDPKRVRSIHVLFASESDGLASRFGHVALRLVVCPEASSDDETCDTNLKEHIAIGFRAHIDEFSLDVFRALSGRYKAYLLANRFLDVYEEYAITEFRSLYSLPLRIEGSALEALVRNLSEIHWRYAGDYRFLSRNCASMLQSALQVAWPAFSADAELSESFVRPDRLFGAIRRSSIAHGQRLDSLPIAEHRGYYFSSTKPFYLKAVDLLVRETQAKDFSTLDEFLDIDPVIRRQRREDDQEFFRLLTTNRFLREAQILLEEYAVLRGERLLMDEGARFLDDTGVMTDPDRLLRTLEPEQAKMVDDCLIRPFRSINAGIPRLGHIPQHAEIVGLSVPASACESLDGKRMINESFLAMKKVLPERSARLLAISRYWTESIKNVNLLKAM